MIPTTASIAVGIIASALTTYVLKSVPRELVVLITPIVGLLAQQIAARVVGALVSQASVGTNRYVR